MEIFEDSYRGNASVLQKLLAAFETEGVTAFTGAGTSMPVLPGWRQLVSQLVDDAAREGKLEEDTARALSNEQKDFLYVVDEIYSSVGKYQTKSKVSKIFNDAAVPTEAHRLIVKTNYSRIMTLNYDVGLERAFSETLNRYVSSITAKHGSEVTEWQRYAEKDETGPILHWHGIASDAENIILSGSDYLEFYEESSNKKDILRNIFKNQRVLMIGFGFADPFIERELNSVMQLLPAANSHFGIIGVMDGENFNIPLERKKFSTKYKLEPIFYPIKVRDNKHDHSALDIILTNIMHARARKGVLATTDSPPSEIALLGSVATSYKSNLFTVGNSQIYCEPNIWAALPDASGMVELKLSVADIANGAGNCIIEAPHEYGLTSVGKRIASDLEVSGRRAIFKDANLFPKYKRAMLADPEFAQLNPDSEFTIILDNYTPIEHIRTVREIISTFERSRVIVLQRTNYLGSEDGLAEMGFLTYQLRGLSRSDIRSVINVVAPSYNTDATSIIVEKVYSDLLQLCIPLTPSNVIMYVSVLCRDGTFSPVSRLHIVERFVSEALRRASDAYADTFNSINKTDLIGEFCFNIFEKKESSFVNSDWASFCNEYKKKNLVEFNSSEILSDILNGRIVIRDGSTYHFRYRMFFSYFVGRHIASRPSLVTSCLDGNRHLELDGLVEVLCGMLHDSSDVLNDVTNKLKFSVEQFYAKYPIAGLDFHDSAKWHFNNRDEEAWAAISAGLEEGPATTSALDELKTSIQAERRSEDQKVSIIEFIAFEKNVAFNAWNVNVALEGTKHADAGSKKAAAMAIIAAQTLAYEVATIFIPLIAENKYVSWNGFTYINLIEDTTAVSADPDVSKDRMKSLVAYALPASMARSLADSFGSRKLGQVFLALLQDPTLNAKVQKFMLFCLLLRSKPEGWLSQAKRMISEVQRDDIYLRHMLAASIRQFKEEINTEVERGGLKELIAAIKLRREANVKSPSQTAIQNAIGKLDDANFWSVSDGGAE